MFRKKLDIEVINLFNTIENKIDNINSNFDSVTFLDGCCRCKERDIKINEMLITFLESKFSQLYVNENPDNINSILISIKSELQNTLVSKSDHKSSFESFTYSITHLINEIQELKENSTNELINLTNEITLLKQNSTNELHLIQELKKNSTNEIQDLKQNSSILTHKIQLLTNESSILIHKIQLLTNESINLTNEIQELKKTPTSDQLLRSDLNTFLVLIKDDIKSDIKGSMHITLQNIIDNNTVLKNTLDILINKTDAIFFDNEIIKHQFSIEENVKFYSDTIDSLKLSIEKSINDIDKLLLN